MNQSFCFILTPLNFEGNDSFEIIPNYFLRRADSQEIKLIKEKLTNYLEPSPLGLIRNPRYEFDLTNGDSGQPKQLPENLWRYWVISFKGANQEIGNLSMAASLLEDEIELGFEFHFLPDGGTGFLWNEDFLISFFRSLKFSQPNGKTINKSLIKEISENHTEIKAAETTHLHVYRAVNQFLSLKALPRHSPMLVIGYFSIIEALIAHKPRLPESLDSINHQLRSKMILLAKKFLRPPNYPKYFGGLSEKEIWKQLYAFRSALAHDTLVDFNSEFKSLGGQTNVLSFLKEIVKSLLLFALKEPVFLADLKNC